ncbi:embryonic polarity protein dorsal-like isoform X2 [Chrysoperla carnea]|uniref:embryonic polarity protein dorsal-like isoform X2 n=1 Tax=Chrysoperla carnea TaxID=189513 RepID=UPI001D06C188|nr:embryonic polarity protein dorsal-like isoform X2 [Chrysoperla carnea]
MNKFNNLSNGTGGCDIHLSDVIEVIENNDPSFNKLTEGAGNNLDKNKMSKAYVEIVEQPASKAMRFRYECEGRSAGSIPGQNSTSENKTFPTIRVVGYEGKAVVVVSCVTKDKPYKPHPHNLVGKEGCKKGVCTIEIPTDTMTVTFSNLGIRCVKKRDIESALQTREEIRVDPFRTGFAHRNQASSIDLNAVRLCFQVFLSTDGKSFTCPLPPVVSEPIFDKKAMSDLAIFQLSTDYSSVAGGQKVLLFCEKVTKDDINVRFYEEKNGQMVWEGFADFQPSDVHRQVGIAFTTPKYHSLEVTEPVKVFIQLFRPSDRACSEPLPFFLTPLESGRPSYWSLRRPYTKKGASALNEIFNSILAADKKTANENNLVEIVPNIVDREDEEKPDNLINDPNLNDDSIQIGDQWKSLKEIENEHIIENWNNISDSPLENTEPNNNNEEKSLNDLLNQVAELDEIYSESQARLLDNNPMETDANHNTQNFIKNSNPMDIDNDFDDTNTYSSLQLAFKNPIDMLDKFEENIISAQSPVIEIVSQKRENDSEKLPPLPPKRVKKLETPLLGRPLSQTIYSSSNSITLSTEQAQSILGSSSSLIVRKPVSRSASFNVVRNKPEYLAPQKNLPPTPNKHSSTTTLPNPKKKGFFTKLFSRRGSKEKSVSRTKLNTNNSNLNTPNRGSVASFKSLRDSSTAGNISLSGGHMKTLTPNSKDTPDVIHISLKGPLNSNPDSPSVNDALNEPKTPTSDQLNLDLTEAEHYALYTAVAPHATQSEFDETSCYYAPVEGGKIMS